jgi:hypothetical protein
MKRKIAKHDKIIFGVPYFDSYLRYHGEVIDVKGERVWVRYVTEVDTHRGFEKITHTTVIPFSFILENTEFRVQ